jgi:hypothetical protein
MIKRKRGRPKSLDTIERERIEALLREPPSYILNMSAEEATAFKGLCENWSRVENEILNQYRTAPSIPKEHAYEMASLGDESIEGYEDQILAKDKIYRSRIKKMQMTGSAGRARSAKNNSEKLVEKNIDLIQRVNAGLLTLNGAAAIIIRSWTNRGLPDGAVLSIKTISRYLRPVCLKNS